MHELRNLAVYSLHIDLDEQQLYTVRGQVSMTIGIPCAFCLAAYFEQQPIVLGDQLKLHLAEIPFLDP